MAEAQPSKGSRVTVVLLVAALVALAVTGRACWTNDKRASAADEQLREVEKQLAAEEALFGDAKRDLDWCQEDLALMCKKYGKELGAHGGALRRDMSTLAPPLVVKRAGPCEAQ